MRGNREPEYPCDIRYIYRNACIIFPAISIHVARRRPSSPICVTFAIDEPACRQVEVSVSLILVRATGRILGYRQLSILLRLPTNYLRKSLYFVSDEINDMERVTGSTHFSITVHVVDIFSYLFPSVCSVKHSR